MREVNAIELHSGEQRQMFVKKEYDGDGFFTPRAYALEYDMLKVIIDNGTLCFRVINWRGGKTTHREYSYTGQYIVHWA